VRREVHNDRNVAGTTKKSSHAEGRALDFHLDATDPSQKALGDRLFDATSTRRTKSASTT
jgi:hypothetical protein